MGRMNQYDKMLNNIIDAFDRDEDYIVKLKRHFNSQTFIVMLEELGGKVHENIWDGNIREYTIFVGFNVIRLIVYPNSSDLDTLIAYQLTGD